MNMTADEHIARLEEQLKQALEQVHVLQGQLGAAQKRIEELEKQKTPPPAFVKTNVKKPKTEEKKVRKKRDAHHNHGRPVRRQPRSWSTGSSCVLTATCAWVASA